jgi:hypothetical protein
MDELEKLRAAGFTEPQIQEYSRLKAAGFSPAEIQAHLAQTSDFADKVNTATNSQIVIGGLGAASTIASGAGQIYGKEAAAGRQMNAALKDTPGGLPALQQKLDEFKAAGRGGLPTLGDLSPRMGTLADFTATSHEPTRIALSDINQARQAGVPARVGQDVSQLAPGGYTAPRQEIAQTAADKAAFAASEQGFEGLRQQNIVLKNPLSLVTEMKKPENKPILNSYLEARAQSISAGGSGVPSFQILQDIKRNLDERIGAAFTAGNGDLGRELKDARERLFNIMEEQVGPQYRSAISTYRQLSQKQELLQEGLDFWKSRDMQTADLQARVGELSKTPGELESFRRGVAGGLLTQIENAKTNSNVARQLIKESASTQQKLELIFGGADQAQAFMKRMHLEDVMARLSDVVGGSATARRLQSLEEPAVETSDIFHTLAHPASGLANWASRFAGPQAIARKAAAGLSETMTTQGSPALEELLSRLSKIR